MKIVKNNFIYFLIFILSSCFSQPNILNSEEVFQSSKNSVVEVKSYIDENRVCYGSAVLIKEDGTFASNAHLVRYKEGGIYKDFENIEIRFTFEEEYRKVSLIKCDADLDISLLKLYDINNLDLKPLVIGDTTDLKQGQKVYAIGNGMNHGVGITEGIISLSEVNIVFEKVNRKVIQCDLTINDGNSGGALLNEEASLIGLTTFRLKDNSGNVIYGIAFCIPIHLVITYLNS